MRAFPGRFNFLQLGGEPSSRDGVVGSCMNSSGAYALVDSHVEWRTIAFGYLLMSVFCYGLIPAAVLRGYCVRRRHRRYP
ncbi:uncharacterized protein LOC142590280 [Dermacentor variabilis]|uniref:uncharacterized protein LOC142590280 n=1 Tax=Dermacentor variabilis TaxID=34621 RepID=UPI003F5B9D9D